MGTAILLKRDLAALMPLHEFVDIQLLTNFREWLCQILEMLPLNLPI
jgi:hypothetical protein